MSPAERSGTLRAVLFDVGNTLVHLDYDFLGELLAACGVGVGLRALMEAEFEARSQARAAGTDRERWLPYFRSILHGAGASLSDLPGLIEKLGKRDEEVGLWRRVLLGTEEALLELRALGLKLGVVSNADGRIRRLLEELGLLTHFDVVVDSHEFGVEKPDPAIFRHALAELGVLPEHGLFVGDLPEIDAAGAHAAGMQCVLVDPLGRLEGKGYPTVSAVPALPALLR